MPHRIEISPSAGKDLKRLPLQVCERLEADILALADDPYPKGVHKIQGTQRAYRIRIGSYRIVYEVYKEQQVVVILRVARRSKSTYKGI
ncbi:MAG: type II toxin-antitoxin system mRNA interferase toxin, RelE/StbE family [Chloroflexi bacterium CG_4_9_14_3_um_filter_45_9]|nr:MAG: hypothetical protein AUK00_00595 [Dehalococcoidia bacterium CG2_30_46_9]PIU22982.1 MAG: type II toxin-antitoxin system mRNA interferase toxin, RelE/StbE family [Chloroflexi bacterium CG08_land_8_20_14_0_20_45_12]PIX27229.1 MAG: type II toxin-antitoxin system mRNA interferase toxin, RelE/StbE family [Chloroflexi bacterium CG_4_8_14_3_um_filter_45_15]PJB49585.1 MAG: type II toxin-antitoxin system mRNA interferase toxin, RelE/StbE family [Chloroflexi bacterium CG_4_9_14_3_um_filter_45_9]